MVIINGVLIMFFVLVNSYEWLVVYFVIFGFCDGVMGVLVNIIVLICVDFFKVGLVFGNVLLVMFFVILVGFFLLGMDNIMKRNWEIIMVFEFIF